MPSTTSRWARPPSGSMRATGSRAPSRTRSRPSPTAAPEPPSTSARAAAHADCLTPPPLLASPRVDQLPAPPRRVPLHHRLRLEPHRRRLGAGSGESHRRTSRLQWRTGSPHRCPPAHRGGGGAGRRLVGGHRVRRRGGGRLRPLEGPGRALDRLPGRRGAGPPRGRHADRRRSARRGQRRAHGVQPLHQLLGVHRRDALRQPGG